MSAPSVVSSPIVPVPAASSSSTQVTSSEVNNSRGKNVSWAESYVLLQLMKVEGKNWGKLLQTLHARHLFTHLSIDEKDKLRVHYNSLKNKKSAIWKPYVYPKFTPPPKASKGMHTIYNVTIFTHTFQR